MADFGGARDASRFIFPFLRKKALKVLKTEIDILGVKRRYGSFGKLQSAKNQNSLPPPLNKSRLSEFVPVLVTGP